MFGRSDYRSTELLQSNLQKKTCFIPKRKPSWKRAPYATKGYWLGCGTSRRTLPLSRLVAMVINSRRFQRETTARGTQCYSHYEESFSELVTSKCSLSPRTLFPVQSTDALPDRLLCFGWMTADRSRFATSTASPMPCLTCFGWMTCPG
jgi:hypothetical protein